MNSQARNEYVANSMHGHDNDDYDNDFDGMETVSTPQYDDQDIASDFLGMSLLLGEDFRVTISKLLQVWSDSVMTRSASVSFDSTSQLSLVAIVERFLRCETEGRKIFSEHIFYVALCYVNKLHAKTGICINKFNCKGIVVTALCLSNKTQFDRCYGVSNFDALAGFAPGTIRGFEKIFLNAIDWQTEIRRYELNDVISSLERIYESSN